MESKRKRLQASQSTWPLTVLFALCLFASPVRAEDQAADCIQPAQGLLLAQATQPNKPRARLADDRRPINERELQSLIRAFEAVPLTKTSGMQIRATIEKSELRADRADLLVRDVTLVLASIQSGETLVQLKKTAGIDPAMRAWMEKGLGAIPGCVRARFVDRGGDPAYAATTALILKNRAAAERMQAQMYGLSTGTFPQERR